MRNTNPTIALLLCVCVSVCAGASPASAASVGAELQEPPPASGNAPDVPPVAPEAAPATQDAPPAEPAPPQDSPAVSEEEPAGAPEELVAQETPATPAPAEPEAEQTPSTPPAEPVAQEPPAPAEPIATQEPATSTEAPVTPPVEPVAQEVPATPPAEPVAEQTPAAAEPIPAQEPPTSTEAPAEPPTEPVGQEATSDPDPDPAVPADSGTPALRTYIWLSPEQIRALPITGDPNCNTRCRGAWRLLTRTSSEVPNPPNLADMNENTGTLTLAKALVAVRLDDSTTSAALRDEVVNLLGLVIGTESGASTLWIGRGVGAYVIAADIIDLPVTHPQFDQIVFRPWLRSLLSREFEGRTLQSCQEDRPNNWGAHCGAARTAIAAYLDDRAEMAKAATVFQGWLGERQAYSGFKFDVDAFGWMSDACLASAPECQLLPVNPPGAIVAGHNVDGVVVDDQRRAGAFSWPPMYTIYTYGALGGAVVQAGILQRFGFDAWQWGNQALRRAVEWMYYDGDGKAKWDTCGDSNKRYVLDLVDYAYGSNFIARMGCAPDPSREGRNIAWTSWTHQR